MKAIIVVSLLVPLSLGDQKINLEDIEKDNLSSEHHQHSPKTESDNENVEFGQRLHNDHAGLGAYRIIASNHVGYNVHGEHSDPVDNDVVYQINTEDGAAAKLQSNHGYSEYTSQIKVLPKIVKQANYQGHLYEWNRGVDGQYQMVQANEGAEKYLTQAYKGAAYIPSNQLLAYSPNIWLNEGLAGKNLAHHFSTKGVQNVPSAVYIPSLNPTTPEQSPKYIGYQIDSHAEGIFPLKIVFTEPPAQYVQEYQKSEEPVSEDPEVNPMTQTSVYPQSQAMDHLRGQSDQPTRYDHKPKRVQYSIRLTKPIYRTQFDHSGEQRHLKVSDVPSQIYTAPPDGDQLYGAKPKSLLGSYVPSHIIAARDSARYRERPIKLESGFLPSKIDFFQLYAKRKSSSIN